MGVPTSGGQQLGAARGSITIDVQSVLAAQQTVLQASRQITAAFGSINAGTIQAQQGIGGFASAFNQLGGAVGISLSLAGAVRVLGAAVEQTNLATAFDRQSFTAVRLAGSQAKLNELLEAYREAMGGTVNEAVALSDVISLQAQGFAKNADQLKTLLEGVRGASLATGKTQEFIVSRLQLELLNQTGLRLNELGLGMAEVRQRAEELASANANLSKEEAYQQAVIEKLSEKFGALSKSTLGQKTGVERLSDSWGNFGLAIGQLLQGPVGGVGEFLARGFDEQTKSIKETIKWVEQLEAGLRRLGILGPDLSGSIRNRTSIGGNIRQPPTSTPQFTDDQINAAATHARAVADIERQANADRLDATRQYEEQRTSIIHQYGLTLSREADDFATSRSRQAEDFNKSITDIRRDGARRELRAAEDLQREFARSQEDSAERIDDLRKDSSKRLAEIDEDFKRDQERREQDFRDDQLSAAGKLDAIALLELRKDRARQLQDAKKANEEQKSDLKEQLGERIKDEEEALEKRTRQAQDAFDRQLADAREADAEREADATADQALRQAREDEDRAIRLRRMAVDHNNQLLELARQNALRLIQIAEQEALELAKEKEAFGDQLAELNIFTDAWLARQRRWQAEGLLLLNEYIEAQKRLFMGDVQGPAARNPLITPGQFPNLRGTAPVASSSSRISSFNGDVNVVIAGSTNMNESQMYNVARRAFVDALEEVSGA